MQVYTAAGEASFAPTLALVPIRIPAPWAIQVVQETPQGAVDVPRRYSDVKSGVVPVA